MKKCNKCENVLEETEFYKDKTKKDGLSTCCKGCRKQWKLDNLEHTADYNKEYSKTHLEGARIRKIASRAKRPEHYAQLYKSWIKANPDKVKAGKDRDYAKNKNAYIQRARLRRVREKGLLADYTYEQWLETIATFDGKCAYCGEHLDIKLTQEHVVPVVKFGEYTKINIIPACAHCNASKHAKDMYVWYSAQEFFSQEKLLFIETYLHECQSEVKVS